MFSPDDAFLTTILRLLRFLPAYPIFGDRGRPADRWFRDNSACCRAQEQTRSPEALLTRAPNAGSAGLNSIHADGPGRANGTARNVHRRITRPGEIK